MVTCGRCGLISWLPSICVSMYSPEEVHQQNRHLLTKADMANVSHVSKRSLAAEEGLKVRTRQSWRNFIEA